MSCITQVYDGIFSFKMSVVSYVFLYVDFGENTSKNSGTYSFYRKYLTKNFLWKGLTQVVLLISNTG